ncbi:response regulator [Heliophilum fasciatum]|uniref:Stage 0 sporulation protein A homolog n=1 Tax=Heliophilum fasciatum TaxID=35700 RepID=A0A4R2S134_9FIRM|nr:response regulator [Heliophilum fasciatum]MCW2276702.1 two-component system response regulator (stage 0 sporulation protein F) [Heliophilum fasciatum]TCP68917.1 two-component system response regulator (stage 0 sporulation protein F) [Heliophilum fasciatum]
MARRILIVDDQNSLRSLLRALFQEVGYEVITATNGLEALQRVEEASPGMVLMDVRMPVLDGLQAMKRMHLCYPSLPVILMTACPEGALFEQAFREGALACIAKPFDIFTLLEQVDKHWPLAVPPNGCSDNGVAKVCSTGI